MDTKADALSAAKRRIIELQKQMASRILEMASEVEKLTAAVTEREAREFLRVTCNLPASELSTYIRFQKTLKGCEALMAKCRVSFPVLKALVSSDADTRQEVLERMEIGARIDTSEIAQIRKRLKEAALTPGQLLAEKNGRKLAAAARRKNAEAITAFKDDLYEFAEGLMTASRRSGFVSDNSRQRASDLRLTFESFFGNGEDATGGGKMAQDVSIVGSTLKSIEDGTLTLHKYKHVRHPGLLALQSFSGRSSSRGQYKFEKMGVAPPPHHRLKAIEICAGAGGMAAGLERAGFEHVALVEFDVHAAATLRLNKPHWNVIQEDVRKIDFTAYRKLDIDLVAGGPPCQPYSSDGHGLGKNDPRDLLPETVRIVSEARPRAFFFENVDGLLHTAHADHVADILRGFRKAGYNVEIHRIKIEDYGIAQERSRVLIIGLRKDIVGSFRMPPTFAERRLNIGDALVDLMAANGWTGAYDWARDRREQPVRDRQGNVVAHGVIASTIVTRRGLPRAKEAARWGSKCVDIAGLPDHAPTAEQASTPGFMPALTARMRARLQNFEDDWQFVGGKQAVADQIGNAVPPRVAQALGLALFSSIKDVSWDWEAMLWPEKPRERVEAPSLDPVDLGSGMPVATLLFA